MAATSTTAPFSSRIGSVAAIILVGTAVLAGFAQSAQSASAVQNVPMLAETTQAASVKAQNSALSPSAVPTSDAPAPVASIGLGWG